MIFVAKCQVITYIIIVLRIHGEKPQGDPELIRVG